jgi:hypothetical protein
MNTVSPHGARARVTNRCRGEATTLTCELLLSDFGLGREATDVIGRRDRGDYSQVMVVIPSVGHYRP